MGEQRILRLAHVLEAAARAGAREAGEQERELDTEIAETAAKS